MILDVFDKFLNIITKYQIANNIIYCNKTLLAVFANLLTNYNNSNNNNNMNNNKLYEIILLDFY